MKSKFNLILPISSIICLVGALALLIIGLCLKMLSVWMFVTFLVTFVIMPALTCGYAWVKFDWTKED